MIYPETGGHNLFHQNFSTNHRKLNCFCHRCCFSFNFRNGICLIREHLPKKRFLSSIAPIRGGGGPCLARIFWPFFHHVTVPYILTSILCYVYTFGENLNLPNISNPRGVANLRYITIYKKQQIVTTCLVAK